MMRWVMGPPQNWECMRYGYIDGSVASLWRLT